MDLRALMATAAAAEVADIAAVRRSLPIAYVLEAHGHSVTVEQSGRLKARCPFHQDTNPDFHVYGEAGDRWACWVCDPTGGDTLDLLMKLEPDLAPDGVANARVFARVRELITEMMDTEWSGPSGAVKAQPFDLHTAQQLVDVSAESPDLERIDEFVDYKRRQRGEAAWPFTAEELVEEWGVGTYGSWVIIPYWDTDSGLISYKRWSDPSKVRFTHGSGVWSGHLYGEWREDDGRPILLVEGESDAWYAHHYVGNSFRVLSLPTGAGTAPKIPTAWKDRDIYLAFDNDDKEVNAGRLATKAWAAALETVGANVRVVPIPLGKDLSTAGDITPLLQQARPLVKPPPGVLARPGGYVSVAKKGEEAGISNFVFVPETSLSGDGMLAFEGTLKPGGEKAILRSTDLATDTKMTAWAAAHGYAWYGNAKDSRTLLGLLQSDAVYLPSSTLVTVAGLHGDTFVWPEGRLGRLPLTYVPPVTNAGLDSSIRLVPGRWSTADLTDLRAVQHTGVMDPLLAWLAICPIRSMFDEFPFILVTGAHESGKSGTIEAAMKLLSGSDLSETFSSTPYAVQTSMAAQNAFPLRIDELSRDARADTLKEIEPLLRYSWNAQTLRKGGLTDSWASVSSMQVIAPVIITGEHDLTSAALNDRMIRIKMDRAHQNDSAYNRVVDKIPGTGLPYTYMVWLQGKLRAGELDGLKVKPAGSPDLGKRQRISIGVLNIGWGLLREFVRENGGSWPEDPDFLHITSVMLESGKHTPIKDAIMWAMSEPDAFMCCSVKENEVWIQPESFFLFLQHPARMALFTLPGGVGPLKDYLLTRMSARLERQGPKTYYVVPYSAVVS